MALMGNRLQVAYDQIAGPLLYAIFAHEIGHELHHDLDPSRASVPSREQRAGSRSLCWLSRCNSLKCRPRGLAPYWSMAGDEFGNGAAHGSSGERVSAFKQGWNLSEWNRPESSVAVQARGGNTRCGRLCSRRSGRSGRSTLADSIAVGKSEHADYLHLVCRAGKDVAYRFRSWATASATIALDIEL